jgi:hypothetical protein
LALLTLLRLRRLASGALLTTLFGLSLLTLLCLRRLLFARRLAGRLTGLTSASALFALLCLAAAFGAGAFANE